MIRRRLQTLIWIVLLPIAQGACRAVEFPLTNSTGIEPAATEIRVIRKGEQFSFLARNTTYAEALQLLAILAGKKLVLENVPRTPVIVESRDTTPENAFVALLMSSMLSYK